MNLPEGWWSWTKIPVLHCWRFCSILFWLTGWMLVCRWHSGGGGVTPEVSQQASWNQPESHLRPCWFWGEHFRALFHSPLKPGRHMRTGLMVVCSLQTINWEHEETSPALFNFLVLASSVPPCRKTGNPGESRCLLHRSSTQSDKVFCPTQVFQRKLGSLVKAGV